MEKGTPQDLRLAGMLADNRLEYARAPRAPGKRERRQAVFQKFIGWFFSVIGSSVALMGPHRTSEDLVFGALFGLPFIAAGLYSFWLVRLTLRPVPREIADEEDRDDDGTVWVIPPEEHEDWLR